MGIKLRPCIETINEQVGIRKKPHSPSLTQKQRQCNRDDLWPGELGFLTWCNHSLHCVSVSYVHWGVHRIWAPSNLGTIGFSQSNCDMAFNQKIHSLQDSKERYTVCVVCKVKGCYETLFPVLFANICRL